MPNLEKNIQNWKRQLRRNPAFEDGDIIELESHLRDRIQQLKAEGVPEKEAFQKAAKELGQPHKLGDELFKTKTPKIDATPPWKQSSGILSMLPNYVKISIRNFKKNLVFSGINVLGLSIALTVSLLVITFTKDQADYDAFHTNADQIYRVITFPSTETGSSNITYASSPYAIASILKEEFPEVVQATRLQPFSGAASFEDERFTLSGVKADSTFFELFDFVLTIGNPDRALTRPNSIILTKETAERFFGKSNPMGNILKLQDGQNYHVTGVLAGEKYRSHLEFEALISSSQDAGREIMNSNLKDWEDPTWYTYVLLAEQARIDEFEPKLSQIVQSYYPADNVSGYQFSLQPLNEINLGERLARQIGRITPIEFIYFLSALALVIIIAACVNYVNLTVARSLRRAKEIGLRKVIGANRLQLIGQFISESVVTALLSLAVGLLLFWGWLLPFWNSLRLATADFGQIAFNTSRDLELYLLFVGFTILVGLVAGIYPAFKLSSFTPAKALKEGSVKGRSSGWLLRRFLVVFQISLSLILLVSTFLLYRQSNLLLNADYGFQKKNIINAKLGEVPYQLLRDDVVKLSGIEDVSATSRLPGVDFPVKVWVSREGDSDSLNTSIYSVDEHFKDNFGLELIAGRNFSPEYTTDNQRAAIINETAVQQFGFKSSADALNKPVRLGSTGVSLQIIGVVKDFQFDFLWNPISPLILRNNPEGFQIVNIQLETSNHKTVLENLENTWQKHEPVAPLDYRYYTDEIDNVYTDFEELVNIIAFLAVMAILIACFGLLAMAHYDTQTRIKEIGIRKVFGANVKDLIILLSSDFTKMIGIAIVFGVPTAIYLNKMWLQIFAHKVALDIWVFSTGVALTVLLTLASIGWQTCKAALMNPVKSLKSE